MLWMYGGNSGKKNKNKKLIARGYLVINVGKVCSWSSRISGPLLTTNQIPQ